jgi:hypothetical protein
MKKAFDYADDIVHGLTRIDCIGRRVATVTLPGEQQPGDRNITHAKGP